MKNIVSASILICIFWTIIPAKDAFAQKTYLFVGTYTEGKPDDGIFVYQFDSETGKLSKTSHVPEIVNPSYLTLSPDGRYLYACTDTRLPRGSVTAFEIDAVHGKLQKLNQQPSGGANPVYISESPDSSYVVSVNYTSGSIAVFPINRKDSLQPFTQFIEFSGSSIIGERQEKSHPHATVFSPDRNYLYVPDLGADKIRVFRLQDNNIHPLIAIEEWDVNAVPGSGPRHLSFHPNGRWAYCMEELSGMISAYVFREGKLDSIQRIFSYSKPQSTYSGADIHISPDGRFLYGSNRGEEENTISIYAIDPLTGKLTLVGHQYSLGEHPRNFTLDPTGQFLLVANQVTNNIVVFKRNVSTGLLARVGNDIHVMRPSCLQMRTYP